MEKKRITALGDSLTRGVVLNEEKRRYSILDNSFIDIIGDTLGLSITNYGKFGCTIDFGQQVIERHADDISASDIHSLSSAAMTAIWTATTAVFPETLSITMLPIVHGTAAAAVRAEMKPLPSTPWAKGQCVPSAVNRDDTSVM